MSRKRPTATSALLLERSGTNKGMVVQCKNGLERKMNLLLSLQFQG